MTESYHDATGGGWKAPPKPPYGGGENQWKKLRPEHQVAIAFGASAGVTAGFATGNPVSGITYGTILNVGECVTCHWIKEMADMYNENHPPQNGKKPPQNKDNPCP